MGSCWEDEETPVVTTLSSTIKLSILASTKTQVKNKMRDAKCGS